MTQTTQTLTDYVAKADKQQIARCGDMPESTSTEVGRWRFLYGNCQFLQDCGINDACLPSYCSHSERGHRSYFFMKGRKNTTTNTQIFMKYNGIITDTGYSKCFWPVVMIHSHSHELSVKSITLRIWNFELRVSFSLFFWFLIYIWIISEPWLVLIWCITSRSTFNLWTGHMLVNFILTFNSEL